MPKGKRKGNRNERSGRILDQTATNLTSDDDSAFDNASVISGVSECRSTVEDGSSETDELAQQEAFEEKLLEAIDGLSQKSAQGRSNCFDAVAKALVRKYVPDFVFDRRMTICDCVEKSLKKGRGTEQAAAAQLPPLLCVQLGAGDASEEICKALKPILSVIAHDNSVLPTARAKCCWSLGLITFLAGGEMGEVLDLMQQMQQVFCGSYLKGDGQLPSVTVEVATLHAAAVSAWSLLLTLMAPGDVYQLLRCSSNFVPSLIQLSELLQSPHLDVRLSAGEAFALIYELGREYNDDFADDFTLDLVETLRQLATDSHKYRAKKDRKQQRATFRDILHYIEDDRYTDVQVRFGQETLILDSWSRRKQYEVLCQTLGSGLNLHLAENDLLREVFQLGPRILLSDGAVLKQSKLERHLMNAANFKARTISRSKNRDKRSAVVQC